jgi:hypothetical protein
MHIQDMLRAELRKTTEFAAKLSQSYDAKREKNRQLNAQLNDAVQRYELLVR